MPTAGFILDKDMAAACTAANVATVKGKATTLKDLARLIENQISSVDGQKLESDLLNIGLFAAKAAKATADAFFDVANETVSVAPVPELLKKKVEFAKEAYGATSGAASGLTKMALGQQGGAADLAKAAIGASSYAAKLAGVGKPDMRLAEQWEDCMTEFSKSTTNTWIDAANNDTDAMVANGRNAVASCSAAAVQTAASKKWNPTIGERMGAGVKIANALYAWVGELKNAMDEWKADKTGSVDFAAQKRILRGQLSNLLRKIAELDGQLAACAVDAARQA